MTTYIAMLRGINVGGHKVVKMEDLRKSFESLGFSRVRTYVQSGNLVFEAGKGSSASVCDGICKRIARDFGFPVPVLLKSSREMQRVVRGNPFAKKPDIDDAKLHVTFLSRAAPKTAGKDLESLAAKNEKFHISGSDVYLYCPNGYGTTKLSNAAIEKQLGVGATTRNWKSVSALLAMAQA